MQAKWGAKKSGDGTRMPPALLTKRPNSGSNVAAGACAENWRGACIQALRIGAHRRGGINNGAAIKAMLLSALTLSGGSSSASSRHGASLSRRPSQRYLAHIRENRALFSSIFLYICPAHNASKISVSSLMAGAMWATIYGVRLRAALNIG